MRVSVVNTRTHTRLIPLALAVRERAHTPTGGAAAAHTIPTRALTPLALPVTHTRRLAPRHQAPPGTVYDAFANHNGEVLPPGMGYEFKEFGAKQPFEAEAGVRVQTCITTSFVGGLIKPRECVIT